MLLLALLVRPASAKEATVSIPMQQVSALSGANGPFYIVKVALPEDIVGKRLDSVIMEFAVDAEQLSLEDSVATPMVGVFPLTQAYSAGARADGVDTAPTFEGVVPSARPIALGERSVVRMDITDVVKGWLDEPASNLGLVIGALTGPKVSTVTLNPTLPKSDFAIRVTFFYQNRFGDRVPSGQ
jgi:hypothetical protein